MRGAPLVLVALLLAGAGPIASADAMGDVTTMMGALLGQAATTGAPDGRAGGPVADVGYGVRTEDYPCYVAAIVNVFMVTTDGVPRDGLVIERDVLLPEPVVRCGYGFESWIGEARAIVQEGAWDWTACVAFEGGLGLWAATSNNCHVADFSEATLSGRVGIVRISDCSADVCVTLQQVFGGTNNAPGHADAASIRIS